MGCYVNPQNETKEDFLSRCAKLNELLRDVTWPPPEGSLFVCLVHNDLFTAAGICYSEREFHAFNRADDPRPKVWVTVPIADLRAVSDLDDYLKDPA